MRWKKIKGPEGRPGEINQILTIWRADDNEKIEFQDLLERIDKEFKPQKFSRRTKINYLNYLVDEKLLSKEKKGRKTFYWSLQPEETVKACLLDLIVSMPREFIVPTGFLTFFGFNLEDLTENEKAELTKLKSEAEIVFNKLARLWYTHLLNKLDIEWTKFVEDEEIHPVAKWSFWHLHAYIAYYMTGLIPKNQGKSAFLHQVFPAIWRVCDRHGVEVDADNKKKIQKQIARIIEKKDVDKVSSFSDRLGEIHSEHKPLVMVGAIPFEKTPLGDKVFELKYTLEKELLETVSPRLDKENKEKYKAQLGEKAVEVAQMKWVLQKGKKVLDLALGKGNRLELLERELCNWVRSQVK